jgi:energy-coupling factor transporter transmembrane protein EcfT
MSGTSSPHSAPQPNPAIPYLAAVLVLVVIAGFAYLFGTEVWHTWKPPVPPWILALHNPLNGLAALVGGIVAVAFSIKPPPKLGAVRQLRSLSRTNLISLGQFAAPRGTEQLKTILGAVYAIVYVALGFAAIATWAYYGSARTPPDVKSLATTFAGMITPIVMAFFS